ncbi:MAG TPA: cobalamin biosynthesis protein CbiG [Eggerthellaceae bacterium]|nr:cobalamin biosynthesis protein CbiG [Eggerthellaceae bacterium]
MNSISLVAFTRTGCRLARLLAERLAEREAYAGAQFAAFGPARLAESQGVADYGNLQAWTKQRFAQDDALVFVGASGIAVRAIAPHVRDKFSDPAVVSVDESGAFAVPLLSGHVGGANELARAIAQATGGQAAVSTATDVNALFAVDEWAARRGYAIVERSVAKDISAALLEGRPVGFRSDFALDWQAPPGIVEGDAAIGFCVSLDDTAQPFERTLHLVPRICTVGAGCRRDTDPAVFERVLAEALARAHVSAHAVRVLASIDVKAAEPAILKAAQAHGWETRFYSAEQLKAVPGSFAGSAFVERTVGVDNVCERAAVAHGGTLIAGKYAEDGVTVAIGCDYDRVIPNE